MCDLPGNDDAVLPAEAQFQDDFVPQVGHAFDRVQMRVGVHHDQRQTPHQTVDGRRFQSAETVLVDKEKRNRISISNDRLRFDSKPLNETSVHLPHLFVDVVREIFAKLVRIDIFLSSGRPRQLMDTISS